MLYGDFVQFKYTAAWYKNKYYFPNYICVVLGTVSKLIQLSVIGWPMRTYIVEQIFASFFFFTKNVSVISSTNCLNCNVTRCKTFDK